VRKEFQRFSPTNREGTVNYFKKFEAIHEFVFSALIKNHPALPSKKSITVTKYIYWKLQFIIV